jgi:hypothetical protein
MVDIEIATPDGVTIYRWDVTFMLSTFTCVYGNGCKGSHGHPDVGCCTRGAWFSSDQEIDRVFEHVKRLPDSMWQKKPKGEIDKSTVFAISGKDDDGNLEYKTRVKGGACIFANNGDHEYPGCSLHSTALLNGEDPIPAKPDICNLYPVRWLEDYDDELDVTILTIAPVDSHYWNPDQEWWCVEDPSAYSKATGPFYLRWRDELVQTVGIEAWEAFHRWVTANRSAIAGSPSLLPERYTTEPFDYPE